MVMVHGDRRAWRQNIQRKTPVLIWYESEEAGYILRLDGLSGEKWVEGKDRSTPVRGMGTENTKSTRKGVVRATRVT